jgi:integrase
MTYKASRCEILFEQSLQSEYTKRDYRLGLKYFRQFVGVENSEELLQGNQKAIQEKVEDYLIHLKSKISPNSIGTRLAPVYLFYEMNDVILNKTKIKKMMPRKLKVQGFNAYTRGDIATMLKNTRKKRTRAIILVLASTGCRVGAIVGLHMRDIVEVSNPKCKGLKFYTGDKEEHIGFLTPEATNALYEYLQERKDKGEKINDEKPIFTINEDYDRFTQISHRPITTSSIFGMVRGTLSGIKRKKDVGGRYEIQTIHGFRKYFNKTHNIKNNDSRFKKISKIF